jgi:transcriptional regulator with XRE-family HTH domain
VADDVGRARYERTRRRVLALRSLLQQLETERARVGLTKEELAERAGANAAAVRRLLTSPRSNPTLRTVLELADALDLDLRVERREKDPSSPPAHPSAVAG